MLDLPRDRLLRPPDLLLRDVLRPYLSLESLRFRSGLLDLFLGEDLLLGEGEPFLLGDDLGDADLFGDFDLLPESARFLGESDSALRDLRVSSSLVSSPLWTGLSSMSDFVGD